MSPVHSGEIDTTYLAMAYRLLDPGLFKHDIEPHDAYETLHEPVVRLMREGPPPMSHDTATAAMVRSMEVAPTVLDCLATLTGRLLSVVQGYPVVRHPELWILVSRVLNADLLVLWDRAVGGNQRTHERNDAPFWNWSAILQHGASPFGEVFAQPMADTHVHLGGAIPIRCLWALARAGWLLPEDVFPDAGDTQLKTGWTVALAEAEEQLHRLCNRLVNSPVAPRLHASEPDDIVHHMRQWGLWEMRLLARAMADVQVAADVRRTTPGDDTFALIQDLEPYIRIRCSFFRAMQHRQITPGLRRFRLSYNRHTFFWQLGHGQSPQRHRIALALEQMRAEEVLQAYLDDLRRGLPRTLSVHIPHLDVELRTSPIHSGDAARTLCAWARGIVHILEKYSFPPVRVGFVIHLLRSDEPNSQAAWTDQIDGLLGMLDEHPALRPLVVGFDVAGDELCAPPRHFAHMFHYVRNLVDHREDSGNDPPVRLGFSCHAGEDFLDLLTGIRCVHETAALLGLLPRDRIGHATALGHDPQKWYRRHKGDSSYVHIAVLDLLWCWATLGEGTNHERKMADRALVRLEKLLAVQLGNDASDRSKLHEVRRKLTEEHRVVLGGAAHCGGSACKIQSQAKLLRSLGFSQPPIIPWEIPADDKEWIEIVDTAQMYVQRFVRDRGLIVELNPTSNLWTQNLTAYKDLPYLRMAPRNRNKRLKMGLAVSINTDNPGVLATSLTAEYDRVGAGLVESGLSIREAVDWLSDARNTGFHSSFLPPWLPRGKAYVQYLQEHILQFDER